LQIRAIGHIALDRGIFHLNTLVRDTNPKTQDYEIDVKKAEETRNIYRSILFYVFQHLKPFKPGSQL